MWMATSRSELSRREVEDWLTEALVPVEPSHRFIQRLKAKLVRIQGDGQPTLWTIVAGLGIATVVVVAGFGLALRLFLNLLGEVGLLERRPPRPQGGQRSTV